MTCPYCAGSGEAWDPLTGEGPECPACYRPAMPTKTETLPSGLTRYVVTKAGKVVYSGSGHGAEEQAAAFEASVVKVASPAAPVTAKGQRTAKTAKKAASVAKKAKRKPVKPSKPSKR